MKIFYHPCHCSLEYDEVKILSGLGHQVFSTGIYKDPSKVKETLAKVEKRFAHDRPNIPGLLADPTSISEFDTINPGFIPYTTPKLTENFLNRFDLIYISHDINLLQAVLSVNLKARVLYNTVSQVHPNYENYFRQVRNKLKIMRFSAGERSVANYAGEDVILHPGVDSKEFFGWEGSLNKTLMVSRGMPSRPLHTNLDISNSLVRNGLPLDLYGTGNEAVPYSKGSIPFDALRATYARYKVFLNLNTKPGALTYTFVEALMTGCPMVSVGPLLGSFGDKDVNNQGFGKTFVGHTYIENGVNGLWSDDVGELYEYCSVLLNNPKLAQQMSLKARETAIKFFDRSITIAGWEKFLKTL